MKHVLFVLGLRVLGLLPCEPRGLLFSDPVVTRVPGGTPLDHIIQSSFTPLVFILLGCAMLLFILAFLVYAHSPALLLNKLITSAFFAFGVASLSFSLSIFPVFYWTSNLIIVALVFKVAYTFLFVGLVMILFSALLLERSPETTFTVRNLGLIILLVLGNFLVLWVFPDSIYVASKISALPGPIILSSFLQVVFFGSWACLYLITSVIFLTRYQSADGEKKAIMKRMTLGWLISGVTLGLEALRNSTYFLGVKNHILGIIVLTVAVFVMYQAFRAN